MSCAGKRVVGRQLVGVAVQRFLLCIEVRRVGFDHAIRAELRAQGTLVVGVHSDWIDTDMAATVDESKISPSDVAAQTLDAVVRGDEEVLTDDSARRVKASLPEDLATLYPGIQKQWNANNTPWRG
ncbi:MAG: hypothetical protein JO082_05120 [Mycobacterium sp.]|nr:hypothetical protein [Mycobacterium sp.]